MNIKNLGLASIVLILFSACSNGPKVNVGVSDPSTGQFKVSNPKGQPIAPVAYADTKGWKIYPPLSEQKVFNYCAARSDQSTQAPEFDVCKTNVNSQTFDCTTYSCEIIPEGDGISCNGTSSYAVAWAESENFVGFNAADNNTLLDFCNITL